LRLETDGNYLAQEKCVSTLVLFDKTLKINGQ